MSAGSYVWEGVSAQGGFGPGCICQGVYDWDLCPAAFAQEAFAPVNLYQGLMTGGLCVGIFSFTHQSKGFMSAADTETLFAFEPSR